MQLNIDLLGGHYRLIIAINISAGYMARNAMFTSNLYIFLYQYKQIINSHMIKSSESISN